MSLLSAPVFTEAQNVKFQEGTSGNPFPLHLTLGRLDHPEDVRSPVRAIWKALTRGSRWTSYTSGSHLSNKDFSEVFVGDWTEQRADCQGQACLLVRCAALNGHPKEKFPHLDFHVCEQKLI